MTGKQEMVFFADVAIHWIQTAIRNGGSLQVVCKEPKALSEAFAQQVGGCEWRELRDGTVYVGKDVPSQRWLLCFEHPPHASASMYDDDTV